MSEDINTWATTIVSIGTCLALFLARWLDRRGQKESKEQNQLAHDLKEREFRWDQLTETVTYQRELIDSLKGDLVDAKGRALRHVKYEQELEHLADQHEAWDDMAVENNPELPTPPPLRPNAADDPYFGV